MYALGTISRVHNTSKDPQKLFDFNFFYNDNGIKKYNNGGQMPLEMATHYIRIPGSSPACDSTHVHQERHSVLAPAAGFLPSWWATRTKVWAPGVCQAHPRCVPALRGNEPARGTFLSASLAFFQPPPRTFCLADKEFLKI